MNLIRPRIPSETWVTLPLDARNLIEDVDFKSRSSSFLPEIKRRALDVLKTNKALRLKIFCEDESRRLVNERSIAEHEVKRFTDHFIAQVTGTVAGEKDKHGLRIYLCIGDRSYQRKGHAPEPAWIRYAFELYRESSGSSHMLRKWLRLQRRTFKTLPPELEAFLSN